MTNSPDDPFTQAPNGSQPPPPQPGMPQAPPPEPGNHGAPQYGQAPPPYGHTPSGPRAGTEKNWMGITALILSLASLITGITAIGGIIFGHMSVAAAKRGEADNGGLGRAGMIIGYIFTVIFILTIIGLVVFFGWIATECGGAYPADWC